MIIVGLSLLARSATSGPNDSDLVPASSCNDRSIYNIVWSCLTTIFACTWLAVHPNVPLVGERLFVRRLKICGLALVAPELIVLWAIRQWFSSRRLALKYKGVLFNNSRLEIGSQILKLSDFGWTQAHGFFAIMGGFQVRQENGELLRVPFDQLESLLHNGDIQITEREILDKSKGDALAKALVLFQVTWFLLQALARANQHLPVTELEVVTLAFAFLNFMTYFCWWNKPLDVDFPVLITTDIPCPPDPLQTDEPQATDPDSQTSYRSRSRTQPMAMSDAQTSQGIRAQNPTPNAIISDGQPISLLQKTSLANHTPNPEHDVPAVTATSVLPLPPQVTVFVLRFKNDDSNRRQSTGCLDEHHFHQGDLRRQLLKSPFSKSCPAIVSPGFLLQSTLEDDDSSHEEKSHHVGTFVHPLPPEPASLTSRLSPANGEIWLQVPLFLF
ncbi:hypothetical protein H0H93_005858 [Arthromyces matolae]|nr:hypothetical protein H0H93_005858 [Arthromyces matolae]